MEKERTAKRLLAKDATQMLRLFTQCTPNSIRMS